MDRMANPSGKHRKQRRHRGEGSVPFARHDHRRSRPFAAVLSLGVDPTSGKRIRRWFSGVSRSDAEAKRDAARRALARHLHPEGIRMTVADALERYLDSVRPPATRATTYVRYEGIVNKHLLPTLGGIGLWSLDQATIRRAMPGWGSPQQQIVSLGRLKSALKLAVSERLVERNEAEFVKAPRAVVREAPAIAPIDGRRILQAARPHRLYGFVVLSLSTGLRRGELLGLHWSDLDLGAGTLRLRWQLRYIPQGWRTKAEADSEQTTRLIPPKTRRSARLIPLPALAVEALIEVRSRQDAERRAAKVWAENDLVFADPSGNSLSPKTVSWQVMNKILPAAGYPAAHLHDLRSAFSTILAFEGVHPRVAQDLMGHATMQQTADYTKVVPSAARDAAERIDRALGGR